MTNIEEIIQSDTKSYNYDSHTRNLFLDQMWKVYLHISFGITSLYKLHMVGNNPSNCPIRL